MPSEHQSRRPARFPRGAFTVLELLIALAILAALAAITLPSARSWWQGARRRDAAAQLEAVLAVCRSDAVKSGAAVAVMSRPGAAGVQIVSARLVTGPALVDERTAAGDRAPPAPEWRVRYELRAPLTLVRALRSESGDVSTQSSSEPLPIAVFWPDGTGRAENRVELRDARGSVGSLSINTWTGAASIVPPAPRAPDSDPSTAHELPAGAQPALPTGSTAVPR